VNADALLQKYTATWERRAQVKRTGVLEVPFDPAAMDFLPELLPAALVPAYAELPAEERHRLLTYGWLVFNQKAIEVEHHVLIPACLRLLERATEDGDWLAAEAVSQALVDESYHILLVRQANQRTLDERRLPAPRFAPCRTVERMREHQRRSTAPWQRELTVIAAAIVTEVFIKGYLGALSVAEGVQPLCVLTTRAHLADEAVHSSLFLSLAEKLHRRLGAEEQEFFADALVRAMAWFPDPELAAWEVAIHAARLSQADDLLRRCRAQPLPEIDYTELASFLRRVGVEDVDRYLTRVHQGAPT
jgi:alpha-N-dichloroacetyl-p-aminophenylserinol N-oxygenase